MDSRSNATATGASYDASGLIRFGCETNRGKGVTNRVTVNQVPYRCILRGGNRMCQAIRSCCDNRRLRTALEITERLCYDSRRASRRREHTCARSSGDRAFGCGPKGRGFKSLRAYRNHRIGTRKPPASQAPSCIHARPTTTVPPQSSHHRPTPGTTDTTALVRIRTRVAGRTRTQEDDGDGHGAAGKQGWWGNPPADARTTTTPDPIPIPFRFRLPIPLPWSPLPV